MQDKKRIDFFKKLHIELGNKYNVPSSVIHAIRTAHVGHHLSKEQYSDYLRQCISRRERHLATVVAFLDRQQKRKNDNLPVKDNIELTRKDTRNLMSLVNLQQSTLAFIMSLTDADWQEINQKTQFDR